MHTRKDYLDGKCSHAEYYRQFVTPYILGLVDGYIGVERIRASRDPHLNDIPLAWWDAFHHRDFCRASLKLAGDFPSLCATVCICKEAARMLLEQGK